MEFKKRGQNHWRHLLTAPFIYLCLVPIALCDIIVEIYHHVSFPVYGIPLVDRDKYVRIDRQKLSYLNWMEKFNCMYCGYANGVFGYFVEIAGQTEKYWCGVKHSNSSGFIEPRHHATFPSFGDQDAFEKAYSPEMEPSSDAHDVISHS
jgi:hypothetical protein